MLSVSATTRPPRSKEKNGRDYHFLSESEFRGRVTRGEFLEWAKVHGFSYGTPRPPVEAALQAGRDVIMNIDTQGAAAIRAAYPAHSVLVFIAPPSWKILEERLRGRGQDAEEVIQRRLNNARAELSHAPNFDFLVVNEKVPDAVTDLLAILRAERRRLSRLSDELARLHISDGFSR